MEDEGRLIEDDELFILTYDDLEPSVSDEVAIARGDRPPADTLEKPVEVILPEDREEAEEPSAGDGAAVPDETDSGAEPEGDGDPGGKTPGTPEKTTPKDITSGRIADKLKENDELKEEIARLKAERAQAASAPPASAAPSPQPSVKPFDLDAKYREYADLVADGETETAARVMREIDAYKEVQFEAKVQRSVEQITRQTKAEREAEAAAAKAAPMVNDLLDKHQDFFANARKLRSFDRTKKELMAEGLSLEEALAETAEIFFSSKPGKVDTDPEQEALDKVRNEQKQRTIEKNTKAAAQQPAPVTGGRGARQTPTFKPNALTMTAAERKAMSDMDKRRARGDFV